MEGAKGGMEVIICIEQKDILLKLL